MSQNAVNVASGGENAGSGFNLPDEILSVIPSDPYDQLDLARKITSMAIASRVSKLEADAARMRQMIHEKDRLIYELEEKASQFHRAFQETESRLKMVLDENMKLLKERDSLAMTTKKLGRDLTKLETFKRQLMQSLSDDTATPAETVDIGTCDQSVPKAYPDKDESTNGSVHNSYNGSIDTGNPVDEVSRHTVRRFSMTPYISPRLTPSATPKIISTSVSPRVYSAAGSPKRISGTASPTKTQYEGQNALFYPSSQQSSAANSPPRGRPLPARTPRIDGKEFFRQARSRLSYEQFSAFLANIKELNAQKQTREETLRKAEDIFGTDNKDLYLLFQGLLNRNVH
ncbi:uncharacterized protein At4g15545 [Carica papaya]|uniref:uncharacterized protein At4g15545 n=1 Tax=Carica papaya TaxID=3649 RepID=UPI000B8CD453|nr:uncharacterized protein At4g15545 [Carica papaya]XP_021912130.1 uncharacterized protein At4g15545 [Carica papaya]